MKRAAGRPQPLQVNIMFSIELLGQVDERARETGYCRNDYIKAVLLRDIYPGLGPLPVLPKDVE